MRILITGARGFLGQQIATAWESKGHNVVGLGMASENTILCNLSKEIPVLGEPLDYVIHSAGKAHLVPRTMAEEQLFFDINLKGTQNLLTGLEGLPVKPKGILFISTVAVYGMSSGEGITETSPLLAKDPYGRSKIEAEKYIGTWGKQHGIPICIIRPPLIIGKNAPGNLQQMIRGIRNGKYANIAGGKAKRSMVLAEDIALFSFTLLGTEGIYHLTDGEDPSFDQLSAIIGNHFGKKVWNIPYSLAQFMALTGDFLSYVSKKELPFTKNKLMKMTSNLTYDSSAAKALGWQPKPVLNYPERWL